MFAWRAVRSAVLSSTPNSLAVLIMPSIFKALDVRFEGERENMWISVSEKNTSYFELFHIHFTSNSNSPSAWISQAYPPPWLPRLEYNVMPAFSARQTGHSLCLPPFQGSNSAHKFRSNNKSRNDAVCQAELSPSSRSGPPRSTRRGPGSNPSSTSFLSRIWTFCSSSPRQASRSPNWSSSSSSPSSYAKPPAEEKVF